jgi:hypothetical protein
MSLPKKQRTFYFDYTDDYGEQYKANFTIKCRLTMRERHAMELEKSRILGGNVNPTNGLMGIAVMVATLRAHIAEAPSWWTESDCGLDLDDEEIVVALFDKLTTEQLAWHDELTKKAIDSTKSVEQSGETPQGNG